MDTVSHAFFARRLKRAIVVTMIVSFSVAAVGGIIVLLSDVWSETAGQVLATTVITGVISIAVFCGAMLVGRPVQWFGILTVSVSVCALVLLLALVWYDVIFESIGWEWLPTASILTATGAVSSLILLLVRHRSLLVQIALAITLALVALGTIVTLIMVWVEEASATDWFVRLVGIVWILAALGIVVVPVSSLLLRQSAQPGPEAMGPPSPSSPAQSQQGGQSQGELSQGGLSQGGLSPSSPAQSQEGGLSQASMDRINSAAGAAGITPDELIERLLGTSDSDACDGSHDPDGPNDPDGPDNRDDSDSPDGPDTPALPRP
ncbi:hypothetical protein [Brevibacterium sp.]|uniref:hypothetical protein n=1 Tax=Brevibacterium sp. TaxID=1701 RepID=UPI00281204D2|nr:hypothetical protein [Brevibacterium sp.]